jgi:hypothetical protein
MLFSHVFEQTMLNNIRNSVIFCNSQTYVSLYSVDDIILVFYWLLMGLFNSVLCTVRMANRKSQTPIFSKR